MSFSRMQGHVQEAHNLVVVRREYLILRIVWLKASIYLRRDLAHFQTG